MLPETPGALQQPADRGWKDTTHGILPLSIGEGLQYGLIAVMASALLLNEDTPFPGYAAVVPVLGAAAVIAGGTVAPGTGAEILLRRTPFQLAGRLSYSLYLWHWPVLAIATQTLGETLSLPRALVGSYLST